MNQDTIKKFYDQYTERQSRVGVNARHISILKKAVDTGLKSSHNVLEIGCGIGTFTSLLISYISAGQILALDISPKSIELAQEAYSNKNVRFEAADATEYDFGNETFDVIILPDVLEHIPLELHTKLFEKLSKILTPNGFVSIHIPNPYYLEWCHKHKPEMLQVIDQPIYTDMLISNTAAYNFYIHEIHTYSIWIRDCDYQYIVLKKKEPLDFSIQVNEKTGLIKKIKDKYKSVFTK